MSFLDEFNAKLAELASRSDLRTPGARQEAIRKLLESIPAPTDGKTLLLFTGTFGSDVDAQQLAREMAKLAPDQFVTINQTNLGAALEALSSVNGARALLALL